jgi:polyphosphate kinase
VRLEVADNCSVQITDFLLAQFNLGQDDLYRVDGPVNLVRLMNVPDWVERPDLKFPGFFPRPAPALDAREDMFSAMREGDILLHHPFPVVPAGHRLSGAGRPRSRAWSRSSRPCTAPASESELMEILIAAAARTARR